jgi:hypothetical protein
MRRIVVPLLVPTVVIVVAACRDPEPDTAVDGTATTSSLATPTTTATSTLGEEGAAPAPPPPESDEEAVVAAVVGYWDAVTRADYSEASALLERNAAGAAHARSSEVLSSRRALGQSVRFPVGSVSRHDLEVITIEGDQARVRDCAVDDTQLIDVASGGVLNDRVSTYLWHLVLRKTDGWRVESAEVVRQWEGSVECGS